MCVIYWTQSDKYQLILAANRDEFLARPTTQAAFHSFQPPSESSPHGAEPTASQYVLSGLDLEGGGTWLGLSVPRPTSPSGMRLKFATLTNYTETLAERPRTSRGQLVKDFLAGDQALDEYLSSVELVKADYAGFNLVLGVLDALGRWKMGYVSNRNDEKAREIQMPEPGSTESVSNTTLSGEPWPKCRQGSQDISRAVREGDDSEEDLTKKLWRALSVAQPMPILDRTHLRHTVLVRPTFMDPKAPVPTKLTPFVPAPNGTPSPDPATPIEPGKQQIEGKTGFWYGTRSQSMLLVTREPGEEGRLHVTFRERDAYVMPDNGVVPSWNGQERSFDFVV